MLPRMSRGLEKTGIWQDTRELPESLAATLDAAEGFDGVAALLGRPGVRRVVVTGNGASYHAAHALWLAALESERSPAEVVAVPAGLLARGAFRWRDGDALLGVSSSGELRDLVEAAEDPRLPRPFALVTATPDSTLGRSAGALALVRVLDQRAVTHTQAFCGGVLACLAVWARATREEGLARALGEAPAACARAIERTLQWAAQELPRVDSPAAAIAFGTGPGWAAALEAALLVKEVARVPCEGVETREGATAAMTALAPGHLALSLPTGRDPIAEEAEAVCAARGAPILRAPGGEEGERSLAAITTFPAAVALGAELALRSGHDPDRPAWIDAYYKTARRAQ
jgi:fructoselysine-6-P-deglycase FrlB-like protein